MAFPIPWINKCFPFLTLVFVSFLSLATKSPQYSKGLSEFILFHCDGDGRGHSHDPLLNAFQNRRLEASLGPWGSEPSTHPSSRFCYQMAHSFEHIMLFHVGLTLFMLFPGPGMPWYHSPLTPSHTCCFLVYETFIQLPKQSSGTTSSKKSSMKPRYTEWQPTYVALRAKLENGSKSLQGASPRDSKDTFQPST